jgi:hypothetical protein
MLNSWHCRLAPEHMDGGMVVDNVVNATCNLAAASKPLYSPLPALDVCVDCLAEDQVHTTC